MTDSISVDEYRKLTAKPHKYRAKACVVDGYRFDSQKEARYYESLKLAVQSGELLYFFRQVPIHIDPGVKMVIDFLEFWKDGKVRHVDVKGHRTKEYLIKKKLVEARYPIRIIEE